MYSKRDMAWIITLAVLAALCAVWGSCHAALPTGYYGRAVLTAPAITGSHSDVPVLFKAPRDTLKNLSSGADIRVYTSGGDACDMEIAQLGPDTVAVWFEAPTLATGSVFYVYFGNSSVTTVPDYTLAWSSASAVYHYNNAPTLKALSDASGNQDAVLGGSWVSGYRGSGKVGTAYFNDALRGVSVPDLNVTGDWTIMCWLRPIGQSTDVIAQGSPWWWFVSAQASDANTSPSFVARYGTWNVSYHYSDCANDGTWAQYAVTYTTTPDTALAIYRNGGACTNDAIFQIGTPNDISGWYELGYDIDLLGRNFNGGDAPFGIASQSFYNDANQQDQFNGWVDEYMIFPSALSAGQIAAMYTNQNNPTAFWSQTYEYNIEASAPAAQVAPPQIASVTGYRNTNGGRITLTGSGFGSRSVDDISMGLGPDSWIEREIEGTRLLDGNVTAEAGWGNSNTPKGGSTISTLKPYSGSQSIYTYVGAADGGTYCADASCWQQAYNWQSDVDIDEVFFSFYVYYHPIMATGARTQWKLWRINATGINDPDSSEEIYSRFRYNDGGTGYYDWGTITYCSVDANDQFPPCVTDKTPYTINSQVCIAGASTIPAWSPVPAVSVKNDFYMGYHKYEAILGDAWYEIGYNNTMPIPDTWSRIDVYAKPSDDDTYNGRFQQVIMRNGERAKILANVDGLMTHRAEICRPGTDGPWRYVVFQNYFDADGTGDERADFFIDDIYIQVGTQARVEIGNNNSYWACTKREIQPIASWSSTTIGFDYNDGAFDISTPVWAFVVTDDGQVSPGVMISAPPSSGTRRRIGG